MMISISNPLELGILWLYVTRLWTNHAWRPLSARTSGASSRVSGVTLFLPSRLCRHTLVAMHTNKWRFPKFILKPMLIYADAFGDHAF